MPHASRSARATHDFDVDEVVRETLRDVTPRAAALALLRFSDYLDLIRQAGVAPTDELCVALFDELRAVCHRDRRAA
jgi:hypothetical protein